MSDVFRVELDKLQIAAQHLSAGVCGYFGGENPSSVMHVVRAAKDLSKNLAFQFSENAQMPSVDIFSDDESLLIDFGSGRVNRSLSNFVKHANKDYDQARVITSQVLIPFLYAAIIDFQRVKNTLIEAGLAGKTCSSYYKEGRAVSRINLRNAFSSSWGKLEEKFYDRTARVDAVSALFLDWYNSTQISTEPSALNPHYPQADELFRLRLNPLSRAIISALKFKMSTTHSRETPELQNWLIREQTKAVVNAEIVLRGYRRHSSATGHYFLKRVKGENGEYTETVPAEYLIPYITLKDPDSNDLGH